MTDTGSPLGPTDRNAVRPPALLVAATVALLARDGATKLARRLGVHKDTVNTVARGGAMPLKSLISYATALRSMLAREVVDLLIVREIVAAVGDGPAPGAPGRAGGKSS